MITRVKVPVVIKLIKITVLVAFVAAIIYFLTFPREITWYAYKIANRVEIAVMEPIRKYHFENAYKALQSKPKESWSPQEVIRLLDTLYWYKPTIDLSELTGLLGNKSYGAANFCWGCNTDGGQDLYRLYLYADDKLRLEGGQDDTIYYYACLIQLERERIQYGKSWMYDMAVISLKEDLGID